MGCDNQELLLGDVILLVAFCLEKQICAIIFSPSFPGWLAPLSFQPYRFGEFIGFAATVSATWFVTSFLSGDYSQAASSGVRQSLLRTCRTWLISMPVIGAQLVLATAAESQSLIADSAFAVKLPLAASGFGEPFVSAAGVLGVMLIWRTYYAAFLDWGAFTSFNWSSSQREQEAQHFLEALSWVVRLSCGGIVLALLAHPIQSLLMPGQPH